MNVRFALPIALGALCFGCATPAEQPAATGAAGKAGTPTATAPAQQRPRSSVTGSRLPPLDDDATGGASVGAVSKDDYMHDNDTRIKILESK